MESSNAALYAIAAATAAGLSAQVLAHRLRIPAIVPLLAFGVLLGPSVLDVVHPQALGTGLPVIVKLAVAVILFDGALNLRITDLRGAIGEVRNLVTIGVLITWVGAAIAARFIAELSWPVAAVFGALVTVTGPTVVQPLLKRVPLERKLRTVLEGEAILIDPIGAVLAVAAVDVVLGLAGVHEIGILGGVWGYVGRLLIGLGVGAVGGIVTSRILKLPHVVPADLANLVALAAVWGVFAVAEVLRPESGIMAAVAMGLALQREAVPEERRLRRFKEQLTALGISLIFVLLAADLPLAVIRAEGWRGLLTVLALMLVIRPINVALSLKGSSMTWREKAFIAWIAPRGIVAASVASLFALSLTGAGFSEGTRLLAITFLTIALTVTLQGLTASGLSRILRLQSLVGRRAIVIGAGAFGRGIAEVLRENGRPVVVIDRNPMLVAQARSLGFEALAGNALEESVLEQAGADDAETLVAVTSNSEVNALAAHLANEAFGVRRSYPALANPARGAGPSLIDRVGGLIAFDRPLDIRAWEHDLDTDAARFVKYKVTERWAGTPLRQLLLPDSCAAVARIRDDSIEVASPDQQWQRDDVVVLVTRERPDDLERVLDAVERTSRTPTAPTPAVAATPD